MPMRSVSAGEKPLLKGRRFGRAALLSAVTLLVFLVPASCVITDSDDLSTSIVVRFDEDGFTAVIGLERPVRLPLNEDDAYYVMHHCSCTCRGDLVRLGDYWQYPEYPDGYGCFIRIHVHTGDVDCFTD